MLNTKFGVPNDLLGVFQERNEQMEDNITIIVESLRRIYEEGDENNYVNFSASTRAEKCYYIQLAGRRGDALLDAEAVGNKNLEPNSILNEKQLLGLQSMGWNPPLPGDLVGNFHREWEASDDNDRLPIAKSVMRTFTEAYGIGSDEPLEVDLYLGHGEKHQTTSMLPESDSLGYRAYREAGHAVMWYLIIKTGLADDLFAAPIQPSDRKNMLAEFQRVIIMGKGTDWGKFTFSLRSLLTTPLVLLAGNVSEKIKYNIDEDITYKTSSLTSLAHHLIGSHIEEYEQEKYRSESEELQEGLELVERELRTNWASVEMLARALLQHKALWAKDVFEIIEKHLSEEAKAKASSDTFQ